MANWWCALLCVALCVLFCFVCGYGLLVCGVFCELCLGFVSCVVYMPYDPEGWLDCMYKYLLACMCKWVCACLMTLDVCLVWFQVLLKCLMTLKVGRIACRYVCVSSCMWSVCM